MERQTLILKAPKSFVDRVLLPEFQQINAALSEYLAEVTDKVIREEVFREAGEAEEVKEPGRMGRRIGRWAADRGRGRRRPAIAGMYAIRCLSISTRPAPMVIVAYGRTRGKRHAVRRIIARSQ